MKKRLCSRMLKLLLIFGLLGRWGLSPALCISQNLAPESIKIVVVEPGNTISYLCFKYYKKYNRKIAAGLLQYNPDIKDIGKIYVGQKLKFPRLTLLEETPVMEPDKPVERQKKTSVQRDENIVNTHGKSPKPTKKVLHDNSVMQKMSCYLTYIKGDVQWLAANREQWQRALPNHPLTQGDQIKTFKDSAAEIITEDGQVIRLSENSLLTINRLENNPVRKIRKTSLLMSIGRLWHKARKLFNPESEFHIRTPNSISGIRGTTYSIDVLSENEVKYRTYAGAIEVVNPNQSDRKSSGPYLGFTGTHGPVPVSGPRPVTMQEWNRIILKKFQELTVMRDQGAAIRPFSPDTIKGPDKTWLDWNRKRDKELAETPVWQ